MTIYGKSWMCAACGCICNGVVPCMNEQGFYLCSSCALKSGARAITEEDVRRIVREELARNPRNYIIGGGENSR